MPRRTSDDNNQQRFTDLEDEVVDLRHKLDVRERDIDEHYGAPPPVNDAAPDDDRGRDQMGAMLVTVAMLVGVRLILFHFVEHEEPHGSIFITINVLLGAPCAFVLWSWIPLAYNTLQWLMFNRCALLLLGGMYGGYIAPKNALMAGIVVIVTLLVAASRVLEDGVVTLGVLLGNIGRRKKA